MSFAKLKTAIAASWKPITLVLLFVASANAQKVEIESDGDVNFAKFKTFAIRQSRLSSNNPSLNNDLIKKRLNDDIRKYLGAKGVMPVDSEQSDLNLRYTLGAARDVQTEAYPAGWRGWGTRVVRVPYTEGTLVIDLRDSRTQSLVWRAIVRADQSDAGKVESKLDQMVKKAFDKYPPKTKQ